ncbi:PREDICTED: uncharacterized protein LOC105556648 [Vollenhovia emeryi]|uniref:uncharacterized protein LOC105556648 n=1 Tax=Vollenhovia emeryi TaxID=411798 RepID=UPI0005F424EA|nr:PREDICTED: uncharacterized protein LOC105556648 [Vollenhovia emeryi]
MTDILNIGKEPIFDDHIVKIETHTYNPFANTIFGNSGEIRIPIQQQDLYTLPHESFLYIEGKLTTAKRIEGSDVILGNNCVAFIFDEIRYELDGVEIDQCGWDVSNNGEGNFNSCVPLSMLLGFCEDYKRVVINARHELILIRSRNDNNCLFGPITLEPQLEIFKIQWQMPHVLLNEVNKLSMLRALESGQYLNMGFRSWDLYEFPLLQQTTKHSWAIKTATQLEKPRCVIFALQTNRKNIMSENVSQFNHCKLSNVKLYLNSECYPYDDMNLDFDKSKWSSLYDAFLRFRKRYCGNDDLTPGLTVDNFLEYGPFVTIDCSRQNESVKSATVDVRLEFECKENVQANTTAYCFLIHDRVVQYNPLTNVVRKIT